MLFCRDTEPNARQGTCVLCELKVFLIERGLEPVFRIRTGTKDDDVVDMLKTPGLVDETMLQKWIEDLTANGVLKSASEGTGCHPICDTDL